MRLPRLSFFSPKVRAFLPCSALFVALSLLGGCEEKGFIDPTQVGRWRKTPLVVNILDKIDPANEPDDQIFAQAKDPTPEDRVAIAEDYHIGKNDQLNVSIQDVVAPNVETVKVVRVSETGNITLPLIGQIHAQGLTESELQEVIDQKYIDTNQVKQPRTSVQLIEARARTFSVIGSVNQTGEFAIIKTDFRILDALVLARDTSLPDQEYLYVVRGRGPEQPAPATTRETGSQTRPAPSSIDLAPPESRGPGELAPQARHQPREANVVFLQTRGEEPATRPAARPPGDNEGVINIEGRNVNVEPHPTDAATTPPAPAATRGFEGFDAGKSGGDISVLRIPIQKLKNGALEYNIVIRPNDMIVVPPPVIGEYYMGGHVQQPGVFSLTNRKITLKQAVIAARMLDAIAIPERTEIVRRIGPNKEVFVRVDLDKIFDGQQPDLYLKPYDQVNVGTNAVAPFLAALRGAFRITYGFGFLYDRNFYTGNNRRNGF